MKKSIIVIMFFIGLAGWQCSKIETKPDLRQSLQKSAAQINEAAGVISQSSGYQFLSVTEEASKSFDCFDLTDTITLGMVAGVYDYQPDAKRPHHYFFPVSLFKKTAESEHMIVNLPHRLMFRPKYLHNYCSCDSVKANNFTIDASDYHYILEHGMHPIISLMPDLHTILLR